MDNNNQNTVGQIDNPENNQNVANSVNSNTGSKSKKTVPIILLVIVGIIIIIGVLIFGVIKVISASNSKLVCTSNIGNITIIYNKDTIIGYTATGSLSYDLDSQKVIAQSIGTDAYMIQFDEWFKNNTNGTCVNNKK